MRLWSLHPSQLDRRALVAGWREALLAQKVLAGGTRGYTHHPQLQRFRATDDPLVAIATYLHALADDADARGYSFDRSRVSRPADEGLRLSVTAGQLDYEWQHLRAKVGLATRSGSRRSSSPRAQNRTRCSTSCPATSSPGKFADAERERAPHPRAARR